MASLHQRPRSPYWHASFLAPDGRWKLCSTKCKDRSQAMAVALEFERAAKLGRAGNLVEAQARKVVADIMERAGGDETLRAPSVKDFLSQWIAAKVSSKAKGTSTRYAVAVADFLASLGGRTAKPLTSLTAGDVERFLIYRTDKGLAPQTLGRLNSPSRASKLYSAQREPANSCAEARSKLLSTLTQCRANKFPC
jgi:hypothetical protein